METGQLNIAAIDLDDQVGSAAAIDPNVSLAGFPVNNRLSHGARLQEDIFGGDIIISGMNQYGVAGKHNSLAVTIIE